MEDGGSTGERSEGESGDMPSAKGMLWDQAGRPFQVMGSGLNSNGMTLLVQSKAASGSPVQNGSPSDQAHSNGDAPAPCPICGDKVSGYHYGIYSCESCKGFFKRTVQNGKSFTCRHRGQCSIAIANRKKCPACRFVKCRLAGMRLEAIRPDRTRGGRSSYEGCYARAPTADADRVVQASVSSSQSIPVKHSANGNATATPRPSKRMSQSSSLDRLISVPRPDKPSSPGRVVAAAALPQTLEDLLAAEALMDNDEDEELESRLSLQSGDPFKSLFHLIDHCLYKIVRWARNQPDFSRVQTDDQILLLQNCWSEMLFINCCWRSIKMENAIHVGKNNTITMELARKMDLEKVTVRLIDYTNFLRSYQVDTYEIVALKTLLLFSPDVENLSNSDAVRSYQEQLLEILMMYTNERYPNIPNKFGHLLMKQAELSRTCYLAKEQLIPYERSGKIPAQSLLHELLKGDLPLH